MAVFRTRTAATLALVLWAFAGAFACADPPPWSHGHGHGRAAHAAASPSHGVLAGTLAGVDYAMGSILIATPRGTVAVAVRPSTSIFRGTAFGSFADLRPGARVTVDFTAVGGRLIAQIIRIR